MSSQKLFNISSPIFRQRATLVFLWLVIVIGLISVRSVILPFLLGALLAYVFHPMVALLGRIKIRRRPMPRVISVFLIYLFFVGLIFLFCAFFVPRFYFEMIRLARDATTFINSIDEKSITRLGIQIEEFFRDYQIPLEIVGPTSDQNILPPAPPRQNWVSIDLFKISNDLLSDTLIYIKSETKHIISSAQHIFSQFISAIFMTLLVFMITGFLLIDVKHIKEFLFTLVPVKDRTTFDHFLVRLDHRLSGVVRGQLIICLINAILTLVGLLIFHVKFAFILATIAGIFSIVPVFGSIISTIPIVLVAITISPLTALFSLLWVIGIHILEANLLNPKIMGGSAEIHPVLIVLALLVGEHFYGITGALLAVPLMSVFITIFMFILGKARQMDEGVANPVKTDTIATKER